MAGSYGSCIFNFLRNLHIVFHSSSNNLQPHNSAQGFPPPHPRQHLFVDLVVIVMLTGVRWYLIVAFICFSLMTSDVEHLFYKPVGHLYVLFGEMSMQVLWFHFIGVLNTPFD